MGESNSVAANPASAHARGADGVTVAETFTDVVSRFDTATEELATALHGPFADDKAPFRRAYREFGEQYMSDMRNIQEHGSRLSGNVQAGAAGVESADARSAEDYMCYVDQAPFEYRDGGAYGDREYVNRHLNEEITERYVPETDEAAPVPQTGGQQTPY